MEQKSMCTFLVGTNYCRGYTYIKKNIAVCLKFTFDWVSWILSTTVVLSPFSAEGFPLTLPWTAETLQPLAQETSSSTLKRNFCFKPRNFAWRILQLFSDVFLNYVSQVYVYFLYAMNENSNLIF